MENQEGHLWREVYTPAEAAKVLKCSTYTVQELLRAGKLRGFKLTSHWRISGEALKEYIEREVQVVETE